MNTYVNEETVNDLLQQEDERRSKCYDNTRNGQNFYSTPTNPESTVGYFSNHPIAVGSTRLFPTTSHDECGYGRVYFPQPRQPHFGSTQQLDTSENSDDHTNPKNDFSETVVDNYRSSLRPISTHDMGKSISDEPRTSYAHHRSIDQRSPTIDLKHSVADNRSRGSSSAIETHRKREEDDDNEYLGDGDVLGDGDEDGDQESDPHFGTQTVTYPWMKRVHSSSASSRNSDGLGDGKRQRTAYTRQQVLELEKEFYTNRYLTRKRRQDLSSNLGLTERQVKIWFQNRRMKWKKEQKYSHSPVTNNCHMMAAAASDYHQSAAAMAIQLQHQQHQVVRSYLLSNCDERTAASCGYYPNL